MNDYNKMRLIFDLSEEDYKFFCDITKPADDPKKTREWENLRGRSMRIAPEEMSAAGYDFGPMGTDLKRILANYARYILTTLNTKKK